MTYVKISSAFANRPCLVLREYTVDVVLYDGDIHTVSVYSSSEDGAQEMAASMFDNVDYTMVQGCYEL